MIPRVSNYGVLNATRMGLNLNANSNIKAINSMGSPNWKRIPTKGGTDLSDEEIIEKVVELAKVDARKGKSSNRYDGGVLAELHTAYISKVSPDRRELIKNGISLAEQKFGNMPKIIDGSFKLHSPSLYVEGAFTRPTPGGMNYMVFRTGTEVNSVASTISYNQYTGWSAQLTPDELVREREMQKIYKDAYNDAVAELNGK